MTRGNYLLTFSGRKFYPLDPRPEDIEISDIAHALSHACRFAGHTKELYTVAQHSVHAMQVIEWRDVNNLAVDKGAERQRALWALLHDASEAYIGDVTTPLKCELSQYRVIEDCVMNAITQKFGLWPDEPDVVRHVDRRLCLTEARDLLPEPEKFYKPAAWGDLQPFKFRVVPWSPKTAREMFESSFWRLSKEVVK